CSFSALEPLVFPSRPSGESLVNVAEHLNALRAIEPPVVVHPTPHHRVRQTSQVLQLLIISGGRHPPLANGFTDRSGGLDADRRQEAYEGACPPALRASRLDGVSNAVA